MKRPILMSAVLFALAAAAAPGVAQAAEPDKAAAMQEATRLLADADKAFDAKDFERARTLYATAYGLMPSTDILWSLAMSELESGHPADGLRRLRQYVRSPKARPARVQEARSRYIPEAEKLTGHIEVLAAAGTKIVVDGQLVAGDAPLEDPVDVMPGKHVFEARSEARILKLDVEARAGHSQKANFLDGTEPPPHPPAGPGPGRVDPTVGQPPPGSSVTFPPDSPPTGRRVAGAVLVGVGAVGIAGGILFAAASRSDSDQVASLRATLIPGGGCANPARPGCADLQSAVDGRDRNNTLSYISYGVGAVGLVAGAALLFWPSKTPTKKTTWLLPTTGGLSLHGQF